MASKPGILTDWPWKPFRNFKWMILTPWIVHSMYSLLVNEAKEKDLGCFLVFPYLLVRMLHDQIWIFISRYRTATGRRRIVDKGIKFEQVDRERNWDDQILFNGLIFFIALFARWSSGVSILLVTHSTPSSFPLFSLPFSPSFFNCQQSLLLLLSTPSRSTLPTFYCLHFRCTQQCIPELPLLPLRWFHSLHHTQFRTNYSLFMPIYDYIYGTMDKSTDIIYETSLKGQDESPDVVHLTHLTTPDSIYHLCLDHL
ncbi:hypothetical protein L6164_016753 [Bauhinia variegata]|uniref:Uncharacterized protein n=1 Tax=Bauhinia variegata TaxID=167791 RepID=A0ACB9N5D9_BAUVA|nr:hypothetical protein L6164_016753 [Bauhinia variegata]